MIIIIYRKQQYSTSRRAMGVCMVKQKRTRRQNGTKKNKMEFNCPICQNSYDTNQKKPFMMCSNNHTICAKCLQHFIEHAKLKRGFVSCPFCKEKYEENNQETNMHVYEFLKEQKETLQTLDESVKKLYAFSCVYIPSVKELIKRKDHEGIVHLKIRGKMTQEYQIFEIQILNCLPKLKKLEINNNQIKSIENPIHPNIKLIELDISDNLIGGMKSSIGNHSLYQYLRRLNLRNNRITEIGGINKLMCLQHLDLSSNRIESMANLEDLVCLQKLNLQFNYISKFFHYPYFKRLRHLHLMGNPLQDLTQIIKNEWSFLTILTISFNSKNRSEQLKYIEDLQSNQWTSLSASVLETKYGGAMVQDVFQHRGKIGKGYFFQVELEDYKFYLENQQSYLNNYFQGIVNKRGEKIKFGACQNANYTVTENYIFERLIHQESNGLLINKYITNFVDTEENNSFKQQNLFETSIVKKSSKIYYFQLLAKNHQISLGICSTDKKTFLKFNFSEGQLHSNNQSILIAGYQKIATKLKETIQQKNYNYYSIQIDKIQLKIDWKINGYTVAVSPLIQEIITVGNIVFGLEGNNKAWEIV